MARIIVFEDDDDIIELIRTILERDGHEIVAAGPPAGDVEVVAREAAGEGRLVVITDIFMPYRDGLELTAALRRSHPDVPIIAISGGGEARDTSYLRTAREFGADITLPKPFRPQELRAAIDELLSR